MAIYLGSRPILANGVGGTSLANAHAATHALEGGDPITPAAIGAAEAEHTHEEYAPMPVSMTLALPLSGWTEYTYTAVQTVTIAGMRASKFVIISPAPLDWQAYTAANVRCTVQGYNALTFSADRLPTADLEVNLLIWG